MLNAEFIEKLRAWIEQVHPGPVEEAVEGAKGWPLSTGEVKYLLGRIDAEALRADAVSRERDTQLQAILAVLNARTPEALGAAQFTLGRTLGLTTLAARLGVLCDAAAGRVAVAGELAAELEEVGRRLDEAAAARERAEAEVARLTRLVESAPPWRVSKVPTDAEMRALRLRWSTGPERYQGDADALIAAVNHLKDELGRAQRIFDEALPRERILCPKCGRAHVDGANGADFARRPHHTHLCEHCGHVWDNVRWSFGADVPAAPDAGTPGDCWFDYDPDNGVSEHATATTAREAAEATLNGYRELAGDGWAEECEQVKWGRMIVFGQVRQTNLVSREEDTTGVCARGDFDFTCDYELVDVRNPDAPDPRDAEIAALRAKRDELQAAVDALRAANAAEEALDEIAALCEAPAWEYPGQVVRDVEDVVARHERLATLHGMHESWPTRDVLAKLAAAARHLLADHDCDNHGWEQVDQAVRAADAIVARWDAFARAPSVAHAVAVGQGRAGLGRALREAARELLDAKAALLRGTADQRERAAARTQVAELALAALVELPVPASPPTDAAEILRLRAAARAVSLALGHISHGWASRACESLERALDPAWYAAQDALHPAPVPCTGISARWCPAHGDDGSDEALPPGVWGAQAFQRGAVDECRALEAFLRAKGDAEKATGVRMIGDLIAMLAPTGVPGVVTHV